MIELVDALGKNATEILTLFGMTALVLGWKFPALRAQGFMLIAAAILAFVASPYPPEQKVYPYLFADVAAGIYAYKIWRRYEDWTAFGFLVLSLGCVLAHWSLFWVHPENSNPWIASLNGIYFAMCLMVGGAGYARRNGHLLGNGWRGYSGAASRKGVR